MTKCWVCHKRVWFWQSRYIIGLEKHRSGRMYRHQTCTPKRGDERCCG